jgi:hypothetical protein
MGEYWSADEARWVTWPVDDDAALTVPGQREPSEAPAREAVERT